MISYNPDFISIHSLSGLEAMKKPQKIISNSDTKLLGVTILTSMLKKDIKEININSTIENQVSILMKLIKEANIWGAVSSAQESFLAKKEGLESITPGIRLKKIINSL